MKTKINEIQWPENQLTAKIKFQFNEINRENIILLHNYNCHYLQIVLLRCLNFTYYIEDLLGTLNFQ